MVTRLKKITLRYLHECADLQGVWALSRGFPGFEGKVSDFSEPRIRRHRGFLGEIHQEIKNLPSYKPGTRPWLEHKLLESDLLLRKRDWGREGKYRRDPGFYVGEWIYGLWYLFLRVPSRRLLVEASLARLNGSGKILKAALENLRNPPKLWTQLAVEELGGYLDFLEVIRRELLTLAPRQRREILQAYREAREVGQTFLKFLKGPMRRESTGVFRAGKRDFNFLLRHYHHYKLSAQPLRRLAVRELEAVRFQLEEQARKIDPSLPWPELINRIKKHHPMRNKLISAYQGEVARLKKFLKHKDLVSIPRGETLKIIETPSFTRNTIPYAAYIDPPMFYGKNMGTFFVTPPSGKTGKALRDILEEHNYGSIAVTTLHEGYPGHHLQFARQKSVPGNMMRVFNCSSFYEGWALYCEELMYEQGYYDEVTRLWQLKDKLWRACRVLIDVELHTGTWTDAQAVQFLVRETKMNPALARADVNWYTMNPTVPQGYLTGMLQIRELRELYRKKKGKKFRLKKFHDDLLQFGAVPIPLVKKMLSS